MGKNIAIKVENLSKAYQLGQIGTGTITRDIQRFWATKIMGKEDPFLKIGEANDRTLIGDSDIVWSLKDINLEIEQGDAVGIIGRNGAGKSTLLKLLSRVTAPTTGNIKVKGRIASLLEVGTGFHPELTGRENIYLNGAILGMRKKEITRKFDEIVDFSGVERYIDTPVKRYSSGMYVRLAFAVAAHLESETLIVDEVLAVGDAEFQNKCLGKMGDVSKGEGRTVLFVSHNMTSIAKLCNKGLVLNNGISKEICSIDKSIQYYNEISSKKNDLFTQNSYLLNAEVTNVTVKEINGNKAYFLELYFEINNKKNENIGVDLLIRYEDVVISFLSSSYYSEVVIKNGIQKLKCTIGPLDFAVGKYSIDLNICLPMVKWVEENQSILHFEIPVQMSSKYGFELKASRKLGLVILNQKWEILNNRNNE
jgi:lipopolysaccharide transport system ATP-binding protein